MSETQEIERKFLVTELPSLAELRCDRLRQGYLATGETEVRLRDNGRGHTLTCKRGGGLIRREEEIAISSEQFAALWPLTDGHRIDKTRYYIAYGEVTIELDVYHGALEPLLTAEVEFESAEHSRGFEPPDWFGDEVTEDKRYKNKTLALQGVPR